MNHLPFIFINELITTMLILCVEKGRLTTLNKSISLTFFYQVLSGGVASNHFVRSALKFVCDHYNYRLLAPPQRLCTDNGVMIAWNGIERLKANCPVVKFEDLHTVLRSMK